MTSKWLGNVAPLANKRTEDDIFGIGISVAKEEREDLKAKDKKTYYKVRENCVKGISNKFTQLKSIDENSPIDHFESVYSVVTRFDDLQESLRVNDMLDVFTIASSYRIDGSGPSNSALPIDLFHNIKNTDLGLVKQASQYFMEFGQPYHGENVVWSGEKILNNCDETLRDKLIESTRGWNIKHKGGPSYLKLLMALIVATSEKSLRSLLDKVTKLKLSDFDGEDVNKAVSFLRGAILILRDNGALPNDFNTLVLRIFKATSCDDFKNFVSLLEHNVELKLTTFTTEDSLSLFEQKYTEMLGRNEWTPKSIKKDQESAYNFSTFKKLLCFNCGGLGHGANTCTKPIDQKAIELRKEIIYKAKGSDQKSKDTSDSNKDKGKGNSKKKGKNHRGRNKPNKPNAGGKDDPPRDPLKTPPQRDESHVKTFDGKQLHWCGKPGCCKWGDHKSVDHPANPQGHVIEDIGDGSSSSKGGNDTAGFIGLTSFLGF